MPNMVEMCSDLLPYRLRKTSKLKLLVSGYITEDKFMPISHNLWSDSVSSHWLKDKLVLFVCHAVTPNKILFL